MKDFLGAAWGAIKKRLGALSAFIPAIADELKVAISEGDKEKALAVCDNLEARIHETREMCDASDELTAHIRASVADDNLDAIEGATGLAKIQKLIDEAEDIVTGIDEDDEVPGISPE